MCGQQLARHCQTLRTIHSGICGMIMGDLPADVAPWLDPSMIGVGYLFQKIGFDQGAMNRLDCLGLFHPQQRMR